MLATVLASELQVAESAGDLAETRVFAALLTTARIAFLHVESSACNALPLSDCALR